MLPTIANPTIDAVCGFPISNFFAASLRVAPEPTASSMSKMFLAPTERGDLRKIVSRAFVILSSSLDNDFCATIIFPNYRL